MNNVKTRGTIRLLGIVTLIGFILFWWLQGFWMATKLMVMVWIVSILFAGLMIVMYDIGHVIDWLGNLKPHSSG